MLPGQLFVDAGGRRFAQATVLTGCGRGVVGGQREAPETMALLAALPGDVNAALIQAIFAA